MKYLIAVVSLLFSIGAFAAPASVGGSQGSGGSTSAGNPATYHSGQAVKDGFGGTVRDGFGGSVRW